MAVHLVFAPAGVLFQAVGILRMLPGLRHALQMTQGRGRGYGVVVHLAEALLTAAAQADQTFAVFAALAAEKGHQIA